MRTNTRQNDALTDKARETKGHLIKEARAIILASGLASLSMDRLAQKAGYSKGAVMYHFPTKRHLHQALIEDYVAHLDEKLDKHLSHYPKATAPNFVRAYIDWFEAFDRDQYGWPRLGVALLSHVSLDPELLHPIQEWYAKLYERIAKVEGPVQGPLLGTLMSLEGLFYAKKFGVEPPETMRKAALASLRARVDHWERELAQGLVP